MRFPYRRFAVKRPLISLGGKLERPRPIIDVTVLGPSGSAIVNGLLDIGSDDTVFPEDLALNIGIDLKNAPAGSSAGIGMQTHIIRYSPVTLRVADNTEQREWSGLVGFTAAPLRQALLGYAGFLQYFTATFYGDLEQVELTVNGAYPGT